MKVSDAAKSRKMQLGGGGRFAKLEHKFEGEGKRSPGGLAAWIGRRKYGAKKFNKLAAKGK